MKIRFLVPATMIVIKGLSEKRVIFDSEKDMDIGDEIELEDIRMGVLYLDSDKRVYNLSQSCYEKI